MAHRTLVCSAVALALAMPSAASAASVSGTVTTVGQRSFTIQTPGRPVGIVNALNQAAEKVTRGDYPYVYGGGHAQAGIASVGLKGPGYNGKRVGYDCSGSVAAVLAGAGLWLSGGGVPNDAGIISELRARGMIAPGAGAGPAEVTLYDDPGVHIFMNIDGRFFGTSDGGAGGNRRGGAGWLDDGAPDASRRVYRRYHLLPADLSKSTSAGYAVTFEPGAGLSAGVVPGDKVKVSFRQTHSGILIAIGVAYPGSITASAVVSSIATDGRSLTVQLADGSTLTLQTVGLTSLPQGLAVGEIVQISYTKSASGLTLRSATVSSSAPGVPSPPAVGAARAMMEVQPWR